VQYETRSFDIDVLACPRCGGRLRLIATVEDLDAIRAILAALAESAGLVGRAPPPMPALNASQAVATGPEHPPSDPAVAGVCSLASWGGSIPWSHPVARQTIPLTRRLSAL
jgi:uncharacterized protein YbaR (Trm112 family)